ALADNGEADILVSSPGFVTKKIHVNLYPGAFVPRISSALPISTWSTNAYLSAFYCAIDPATSAVIGTCLGIRDGAPVPVFHWTLSDPTVFQIADTGQSYTQIRALQEGSATITLTVDGYVVLGDSLTVTAAAPRPLAPATDF